MESKNERNLLMSLNQNQNQNQTETNKMNADLVLTKSQIAYQKRKAKLALEAEAKKKMIVEDDDASVETEKSVEENDDASVELIDEEQSVKYHLSYEDSGDDESYDDLETAKVAMKAVVDKGVYSWVQILKGDEVVDEWESSSAGTEDSASVETEDKEEEDEEEDEDEKQLRLLQKKVAEKKLKKMMEQAEANYGQWREDNAERVLEEYIEDQRRRIRKCCEKDPYINKIVVNMGCGESSDVILTGIADAGDGQLLEDLVKSAYGETLAGDVKKRGGGAKGEVSFKETNNWIAFVKQVADDNHISYKEALSVAADMRKNDDSLAKKVAKPEGKVKGKRTVIDREETRKRLYKGMILKASANRKGTQDKITLYVMYDGLQFIRYVPNTTGYEKTVYPKLQDANREWCGDRGLDKLENAWEVFKAYSLKTGSVRSIANLNNDDWLSENENIHKEYCDLKALNSV
jgi:hypothetical protein